MRTVRFLFNDAMARAIIEGRKTVTRRPVALRCFGSSPTPGYDWCFRDRRAMWNDVSTTLLLEKFAPCTPGDLLIGRECFAADVPGCEHQGGVSYRADHIDKRGDGPAHPMRWRPSIHMPDWAARIRRRVLSVTVERVRDITEEDAVREGFPAGLWGNRDTRACGEFSATWDDIYTERGLGWFSNPWVWRIEFGAENMEGEK